MNISKTAFKSIISNINSAKKAIARSKNVKCVVMVTGSPEDKARWQERLKEVSPYIFNRNGKTSILVLEEKIGEKTKEGNFLGTLLAYSRLKKAAGFKNKYRKHVTLMGMLFGRGERMSPFTQVEMGSKPAIISTARVFAVRKKKTALSALEEAMMYFSPVAGFLEKAGFRGILNKWGDETEIASVDLGKFSGTGADIKNWDIIKFAAGYDITRLLAREKDWVVYEKNGNMVTQLSRCSKEELEKKLKEAQAAAAGKKYMFGVSLGPVAVSYGLLDIAGKVFSSDIRKKGVHIDFDPHLITALAAKDDARKSGIAADLSRKADTLKKTFRKKYGRELTVKVLDLGPGTFWTDVGQHEAIREKYLLLNDETQRLWRGGNSKAISEYQQTYPEMIERYIELIYGAWIRGNRN